MDLKDVVSEVYASAAEAHAAFHAGHHDNARKQLTAIRVGIVEYEKSWASSAGDVTKSTTNETPADVRKDTPAKAIGGGEHLAALDPVYGQEKLAAVPGGPATPGAIAAAQVAREIGQGPTNEQPTQ